jgi:hypothetical protein
MLAYRHNEISEAVIQDWRLLADAADKWQRDNDSSLFFDFPAGTDENYNCLFWEILLAFIDRFEGGDCALIGLLTTKEAQEAAHVMRRLARRAHLQKQIRGREKLSLREQVSTTDTARVWRHWYTTLNDMLLASEETTRQQISVSLLPNGVCVAGEWFVAIPQYSAAAENGLEMIKILTSREAELDRMVRGVGLPTRTAFYYGDGVAPGVLSPFFRLEKKEVGDRIRTAFRRSEFLCYSLLSSVLATHIRQILELPDSSEEQLNDDISSILASSVNTLRFVERDGSHSMCAYCVKAGHRLNK